MIRIKIQNTKIPAFLTLSIPVMCVAMAMFIKMFSLMSMVLLNHRHQMEDAHSMEKIKLGILNYMRAQKTLPPIKPNGEIDYSYHINHYIPPNYRLDHKKQPFKLTIYNRRFINKDLNGECFNGYIPEPEDINLICTISHQTPATNNLPQGQEKVKTNHHKVTIYYGDLENANVTVQGTVGYVTGNNSNKLGSLGSVMHLFKNDK